jgi:hypothetical protein
LVEIARQMRVSCKKYCSLLVALLLVTAAYTQTYHFIYIQSADKQPFYVQYNQKTYSSTATGYLILPRLTNGPLRFVVGFPLDKYPEQTFATEIADRDYGYTLQQANNQWTLADLQGGKVLASAGGNKTAAATGGQPPAAPKNNSAFQDLFGAKAATAASAPAATTASAATPPAAASQTTAPTMPATATDTTDEAAPPAVAAAQGLVKASEKATDNGVDMVFVEVSETRSDTIRISIPARTAYEAPAAPAKAAADTMVKATATTTDRKPKVSMPEERATTTATPKGQVSNPFFGGKDTVAAQQPGTTSGAALAYNSNCSAQAEEKDYNKLLKKLANEGENEARLELAKKAFKAKCYTTEQIKGLSSIFTSDQSRYAFYDMAYPFVYDVTNYQLLENQFTDTYYRNRFRAMLRL